MKPPKSAYGLRRRGMTVHDPPIAPFVEYGFMRRALVAGFSGS